MFELSFVVDISVSWLQLPWLTVECYLYVRLAAIIASQVYDLPVSDAWFDQLYGSIVLLLPALRRG